MKKIIEIVESEKTIKKYITLTLLKEVKRKESIQKLFLLLQKRLQSTDKIVLFDLLYTDILRASKFRDNFNVSVFDQIKKQFTVLKRDKKKEIEEAIAYFKDETTNNIGDENITSTGSWFQLNIPEISLGKSITRGQLDDEEKANKNASYVQRTHQIYFTFQFNTLQFDKKSSLSGFSEHIKKFGDALVQCNDFAMGFNTDNKMCQISEIKTIDITKDNIDDFIINKRNKFVRYYTDADNLKVYLKGLSRKESKSDNQRVKKEIYDEFIKIFRNNGFVEVKREREIFGVDFDIQRPDKSIHRTSFGAITAFCLMNNFFKSQAYRDKLINGGESELWKLVSQVENFINDEKNSSTISKVIIDPNNSHYFRN